MGTGHVRLIKNSRRLIPALSSGALGQMWNVVSMFIVAGEKGMINPQGEGLCLVWGKKAIEDLATKAEVWLTSTSTLLIVWMQFILN